MFRGILIRELLLLKGKAWLLAFLVILPLSAASLTVYGNAFNPSGARFAWVLLTISSMTLALTSLEADDENDFLISSIKGRLVYLLVAVKCLVALCGPILFLILTILPRMIFFKGNGMSVPYPTGIFWALISVAGAAAFYCNWRKSVYSLSAVSLLLLIINLPLGLPEMDPVPADSPAVLTLLGILSFLAFARYSGGYLEKADWGAEGYPGILQSGRQGEKQR